jgi:hypothetical protein
MISILTGLILLETIKPGLGRRFVVEIQCRTNNRLEDAIAVQLPAL